MEIKITFNEKSSHTDVISQFIDKLADEGFASREEIIENLKLVDIIYKKKNK